MAKTIEIDEEELGRYRTRDSVIRKILDHPKAGLLLEEAHKIVDSNAATPRLEKEKIVSAPLTKLEAKIAELQKKIEDDKAESEKNTKLSALAKLVEDGNVILKQRGWTPAGIKALDEWREGKGIIDPLLAAPAYEEAHGAQVAPATPSSSIGSWDFTQPSTQDEDYTKKLLETRGESESLVLGQAMKSLKDFRGDRR